MLLCDKKSMLAICGEGRTECCTSWLDESETLETFFCLRVDSLVFRLLLSAMFPFAKAKTNSFMKRRLHLLIDIEFDSFVIKNALNTQILYPIC